MSNTSLVIVSEIWHTISESIPDHDRGIMAENVVGILMEHDFALADIRHEFSGDIDIIKAVDYFSETTDEWHDVDDEAEYVDEEDEQWD